jgi:hypothetical protein
MNKLSDFVGTFQKNFGALTQWNNTNKENTLGQIPWWTVFMETARKDMTIISNICCSIARTNFVGNQSSIITPIIGAARDIVRSIIYTIGVVVDSIVQWIWGQFGGILQMAVGGIINKMNVTPQSLMLSASLVSSACIPIALACRLHLVVTVVGSSNSWRRAFMKLGDGLEKEFSGALVKHLQQFKNAAHELYGQNQTISSTANAIICLRDPDGRMRFDGVSLAVDWIGDVIQDMCIHIHGSIWDSVGPIGIAIGPLFVPLFHKVFHPVVPINDTIVVAKPKKDGVVGRRNMEDPIARTEQRKIEIEETVLTRIAHIIIEDLIQYIIDDAVVLSSLIGDMWSIPSSIATEMIIDLALKSNIGTGLSGGEMLEMVSMCREFEITMESTKVNEATVGIQSGISISTSAEVLLIACGVFVSAGILDGVEEEKDSGKRISSATDHGYTNCILLLHNILSVLKDGVIKGKNLGAFPKRLVSSLHERLPIETIASMLLLLVQGKK